MNENYFPGRGLISFSGQGLISLFQPEAPSPAPSPAPCPAPVSQPSVIYAEPIETHNNREIIQLKEKIKSLEEENKSLKKENWEYKVKERRESQMMKVKENRRTKSEGMERTMKLIYDLKLPIQYPLETEPLHAEDIN